MKMKMFFEEYGMLEWLEPEEFYSGAWSIHGTAVGEDGEKYDILLDGHGNEFRYSTI